MHPHFAFCVFHFAFCIGAWHRDQESAQKRIRETDRLLCVPLHLPPQPLARLLRLLFSFAWLVASLDWPRCVRLQAELLLCAGTEPPAITPTDAVSARVDYSPRVMPNANNFRSISVLACALGFCLRLIPRLLIATRPFARMLLLRCPEHKRGRLCYGVYMSLSVLLATRKTSSMVVIPRSTLLIPS